MPTVISHALVPLIASVTVKRPKFPLRVLAVAMVAAVLPDADVVHSALGIPKDHILGHRGISHSLGFSILVGLMAASIGPVLRVSRWRAFLIVGLASLSHPLADMLTDGGRGIALFWPVSDMRIFFPFRPIEVSPISVSRFFDRGAWTILGSEILWLLLPLSFVAISIRLVRHAKCRRPEAIDLPSGRT